MAEGIIGGILGEDEQKSEAEAVAGAEAFAAAVAAIASRQDPEVARRTAEFLSDQSRLLRTQARLLEDEHALRLAQLRGQRVAQTLRIGFQIAVALLVLVIGAGIAVMLHDAFTSHSVVIDAFNAPAALTARGLTGEVLASDVLDELTRLQTATATGAGQDKRTLSNGWSNEVKVAVPETGISLGEISRLLTARFGHDIHIGGDLVQTDSGGVALTVRGNNVAPETFTGGAGDLDSLVTHAAQYLYSQFQPALWATYLEQTGRCSDAIDSVRSVYNGVDAATRSSLLVSWGLCLLTTGESPREAERMFRAAVAIQPDNWPAYSWLSAALGDSGDSEGAWREARALRRAAGGDPGKALAADFIVYDFLTGDYQAMIDPLNTEVQTDAGSGAISSLNAILQIAQYQAEQHDPAAAELTLQTTAVDAHGSQSQLTELHLVRGLLADEVGDTARAASELEALEASTVSVSMRGRFDALGACQLAVAADAAGHPDEADAVIASGSHTADCQRFRGDILDHRGDWSGAQQAYAQAVALAPDLPAGYYSWGVALARHGDLAGTIAKLRAANQRGPHWADPLKAWGDVLAKQGHWKDALAKYDEALRYAPNWAALRQARAAAAARTGT